MDMRLFSLVSGDETPSVKLQIKIIGSLNGFANNDISFEEHSSIKELFGGLSKALRDGEFIVIAVSGKIYNKTKIQLMKALSLNAEKNRAVYDKLSKLDISDDAKDRNSLMPVGATVFMSVDGVMSGFAVQKGKQTIAVLPLDNDRTDSVLKRGLVPYITNGGVLVQTAEITEEKTETQAPAKETPQPVSEPVSAATQDERDIALKSLNILKEANVTIAVNGNANSAVLREFGKGLDGFDDYYTFTPHIEDRGDYNVTDYTAQLAKSAKGLSSATLGACISDLYTTDECDFICIAVATEKSALVRKLYKEDDETDDEFVNVAAEELFALIGEKASGNNSVGIEIAQDEVPKKQGFLSTKKGKITLSVIAIILVAAAVVFALYYVNSKQKQEVITTTAPVETTTAETTTEAVTATETRVLSQLMRYEALNGINEQSETTTQKASGTAIVTTSPSAETTAAAPAVPDKITVNGEVLDGREAIARIVEAELDNTYNAETLKAQAVVTFTYLKYRNTNWVISGVKLADAYTKEAYDAVNAVYGQYLAYNNEVAFTPYCLISAGKTTTADMIFGKSYDYLKAVETASDKQRDNYKQTVQLSADEIKAAVQAYDSTITLGEDMATWLSITTHDAAASTGTGYVEKMMVGDKEVTGVVFAMDIMKDKNLASPCFSLTYNAQDSTYTVNTFGVGLGVGMSQQGADRLASSGTKYGKLLDKYYPGTTLMTN